MGVFGLRTIVVVLALAVAGLVATPAWAAPGLIGDWSLDETGQVVADTSASGVSGTLGSTPGVDAHDPVSIEGVGGRALRFDGDDWVLLPDLPALEPARITVEAWFRGSSSPGQWRYIVSKGGNACQASSYGLYSAENGGLGFYVYDGAGYTLSPLAGLGVWDGRWHHAAGTFDGSTVRLFVDGIQIGDGTATSGPIRYGIASKGIYIGAYRGSCDLPFVGDIDRVRIWSDALGAPEIAAAAAMARPSTSVGGGGGGRERPDLQLSYEVNKATVRAGDTVLHRLEVRLKNADRSAGTSAAIVTLALPEGTELVSATASRGPGCTGRLLVTCPLDFISGNVVGDVEVAVRILKRRTFVTTAEVSAKEGDLDPSDNRTAVSVRATGVAAKIRAPKIFARSKARMHLEGPNAVVTAIFRVDGATHVSVHLRRGHASSVFNLPGSRLGLTTIRKRSRTITTAPVRPNAVPVQLLIRRADLERGNRYTVVVTAQGKGGRAQLHLALLV